MTLGRSYSDFPPGQNRPHLLLVNLGTTTAPTPEAVRAFLAEFLADKEVVDLPRWLWLPILRGIVLRRRPARVAHQYRAIWTEMGSPLRVATERIVRALREAGDGRFSVSAAYRYGEPSLEDAMRRIAVESPGPVVVVPLFPQRTGATTGTALARARAAAKAAGIEDRVVERLVQPDDAGYVAALAARWREALASSESAPEHVVVSFHGIPVRYDQREGRVYTSDCEATFRGFLSAVEWPTDRATLAYQSKFGPERWLTPATADVLQTLPLRGIRHVAVVTPGFVTEGLETLEEIDIRGRGSFIGAGGATLLRVGAADDHPAFLASLAALVVTGAAAD